LSVPVLYLKSTLLGTRGRRKEAVWTFVFAFFVGDGAETYFTTLAELKGPAVSKEPWCIKNI